MSIKIVHDERFAKMFEELESDKDYQAELRDIEEKEKRCEVKDGCRHQVLFTGLRDGTIYSRMPWCSLSDSPCTDESQCGDKSHERGTERCDTHIA